MPSIADTAARVAAAGVPVLFLDTCSILDVIRAPVRALDKCVEAASELVAMATASSPRCSLVVGSFVPVEWNSRAQDVLNEMTKHLDRRLREPKPFPGLCQHFGIAPWFRRPRYGASGLPARLHDLSRQLLQATVVLDPHQDTKDRAY